MCRLGLLQRFFKDNRMNALESEVARSSKDSQRIQPKPKTQLSRTVTPVRGQESTKEIEKRSMFDHEDVKHSTSTDRPVCGSESTKKLRVDTHKNLKKIKQERRDP